MNEKAFEWVCTNCGSYWDSARGQSFCRICGAPKKLEKKYIDIESIPCVYGPPPKQVRFQCSACGEKWTWSIDWNETEAKDQFCPYCGASGQKGIVEPSRW